MHPYTRWIVARRDEHRRDADAPLPFTRPPIIDRARSTRHRPRRRPTKMMRKHLVRPARAAVRRAGLISPDQRVRRVTDIACFEANAFRRSRARPCGRHPAPRAFRWCRISVHDVRSGLAIDNSAYNGKGADSGRLCCGLRDPSAASTLGPHRTFGQSQRSDVSRTDFVWRFLRRFASTRINRADVGHGRSRQVR